MKRNRNRLSMKYKNFRFIGFIFLVLLLLSCSKKDTRVCYTCSITYIMTADPPVDGYPTMTSMDVEICDVTLEQVYEFEATTHGSDTAVIQGVTYRSSYTTRCKVE
jgi:hypothetical protein